MRHYFCVIVQINRLNRVMVYQFIKKSNLFLWKYIDTYQIFFLKIQDCQMTDYLTRAIVVQELKFIYFELRNWVTQQKYVKIILVRRY